MAHRFPRMRSAAFSAMAMVGALVLDDTTRGMIEDVGFAPMYTPGIPQGHWKTTTFVAGLRTHGMVAPMVLDGPINGELFEAYVEQVLVRYFQYVESIQANIEEKKLQDQLIFTNQSKALAAKQQQELDRATAKGEQSVRLALQDGEAYKVKKAAEADLYSVRLGDAGVRFRF